MKPYPQISHAMIVEMADAKIRVKYSDVKIDIKVNLHVHN
jgi:hypothetical protein